MYNKKPKDSALHRVPSRIKNRKEAETRAQYRTVGSMSAPGGGIAGKYEKRHASNKPHSTTAGTHVITYHACGYPLASTRLIPEVNYDDLCMSMLNLADVTLGDILSYKATIENPNASTTSKLVQRLLKSVNMYNQAMISVNEGKLDILALPSMRRGLRTKTHKIKLNSFAGRRGSCDSGGSVKSNRSKNSMNVPRNHDSGGSKRSTALGLSHMGSKRSVDRSSNWDNSSQFGEDEGTSVSFALSHIYSIEYTRSGSREFSVTFYYPLNDDDVPPTTEFQLIKLTFKADSQEKAVAWVKHILKSLENITRFVTSISHQMVKDEMKGISDANDIVYFQRCSDYHRLAIDLWAVVRGVDCVEVAEAMTKLAEYLEQHGDIEKEAGFWKSYAAKVMKHVDKSKAKEGGMREVGAANTFLDVVREEVETNGII